MKGGNEEIQWRLRGSLGEVPEETLALTLLHCTMREGKVLWAQGTCRSYITILVSISCTIELNLARKWVLEALRMVIFGPSPSVNGSNRKGLEFSKTTH